MAKKLANPQQEIYSYIGAYTAAHAYPPSVREICVAVGLKSTATVHAHLKNLEKQGLITRDATKQRSLRINQHTITEGVENAVPLVGHVSAGAPILAVDHIEDAFPLPSLLLHGASSDETFMLRVNGDSMHDAGIFSGDILVVQQGVRFENGDIVVARIHGENATVKRMYRDKDRIRLQPENDAFLPIYVSPQDVEIAGKVIGLMRSI